MRIPKQLRASLNAHNRGHAQAFVARVAFLLTIFVTLGLSAQQLNQLVTFNGKNGNNPGGKLAMDGAGNIYGTTFYGGRFADFGPGTVYRLTNKDSGWAFTTLYDFTGYNDGKNPWGGVTLGPDGALYGTTYGGGLYGYGVVFKLQPPPTECKTATCYWTETVIHNFTGGSDGSAPQGVLVFDSAGNLYGSTIAGGEGSHGVVYELSPAQGSWNISILHAFIGGSDGSGPEDGVAIDRSGNIYGTTFLGGADSAGVIYQLVHGQSGWTENILHSFAGGDDGIYPTALAIDPSGNLFGGTTEGGANKSGTVFELQPSGGGFSYSIIYQFGTLFGGPCDAECGYTLDSAGNLYGAGDGGTGEGGVVFELSPSNGSWNVTVLWSFDVQDGYDPSGWPILDAQGNLYGTTEYGGGGQRRKFLAAYAVKRNRLREGPNSEGSVGRNAAVPLCGTIQLSPSMTTSTAPAGRQSQCGDRTSRTAVSRWTGYGAEVGGVCGWRPCSSTSSGAPWRRNSCARFWENAERGTTMSQPASCAFIFRSPCTCETKPMMLVAFLSFALSLGIRASGFAPTLFRSKMMSDGFSSPFCPILS